MREWYIAKTIAGSLLVVLRNIGLLRPSARSRKHGGKLRWPVKQNVARCKGTHVRVEDSFNSLYWMSSRTNIYAVALFLLLTTSQLQKLRPTPIAFVHNRSKVEQKMHARHTVNEGNFPPNPNTGKSRSVS